MLSATALATPLHANTQLKVRQPPESLLNNHGDYMQCSRVWYGSPNPHDCDRAIAQLPEYRTNHETFREFYGIMGHPPRPARGMDGPPIQTPIIRTNGG